jgi:hypothetical protein
MVKEIPLSEIILRKYEKPYKTDKREIARKICLSLGLLQEGDGRDVIVDILLVLIEAGKERKHLSSDEIKEKVEHMRKTHNLEIKGLAESNIRRQLKRLRDMMFIDKNNNLYNMSEFSSMKEIFENKIEKFIIPQTIERIKEYLNFLE